MSSEANPRSLAIPVNDGYHPDMKSTTLSKAYAVSLGTSILKLGRRRVFTGRHSFSGNSPPETLPHGAYYISLDRPPNLSQSRIELFFIIS